MERTNQDCCMNCVFYNRWTMKCGRLEKETGKNDICSSHKTYERYAYERYGKK